jgi:hypothetical protein
MITLEDLLALAGNVESNQNATAARERELAEDPSKAEKPANVATGAANGKFNLFNTEEQYKPRQGTNAVLVVGALHRDLAVALIKEQKLGEPVAFKAMSDYYWAHRTMPGLAVSVPVSKNFGVTLEQSKMNCFSHVHLVHRFQNWNCQCFPIPPIPAGYSNPVISKGYEALKTWKKSLTPENQVNWKALAPDNLYACNIGFEFATNVVDVLPYIQGEVTLESLKLVPWRMPKTLLGDSKQAMIDADKKKHFEPQFMKDPRNPGNYKVAQACGLYGAIETYFKNNPGHVKYIPGLVTMPFAVWFDLEDGKYINVEIKLIDAEKGEDYHSVQQKFKSNFGTFFEQVANESIFDKINYTSPEDLEKAYEDLLNNRIPVYKAGHKGSVNGVQANQVDDGKLADNSAKLAEIRKHLVAQQHEVVNYLESEGALSLSTQIESGKLTTTAALVQYAVMVLDADDAAVIKNEAAAMHEVGLQQPTTRKQLLGEPTEFDNLATAGLLADL